MGKKPQRFSWPEAKKRCRLNQNDIEMAKALGFGPDSLIRNIPDPKQKWKQPVKFWVRDLYEERFGFVLGEKPVVAKPVKPLTPEEEAEEARRFEEEMYWEDYRDRNSDSGVVKVQGNAPVEPAKSEADDEPYFIEDVGDRDVPF